MRTNGVSLGAGQMARAGFMKVYVGRGVLVLACTILRLVVWGKEECLFVSLNSKV